MLRFTESASPIASASADSAHGHAPAAPRLRRWLHVALLLAFALAAMGFARPALAQSPPAYLTATPGSLRDAVVWSAVPSATSYNVYRSTTSGGEGSTPYATGLTHTYYVDQSVSNGQAYYYTVTAIVGGTETAQSSESTCTPLGSITTVQLDSGNILQGSGFTGSVTDSVGNVWSPDYRYASSGAALTTTNSITGVAASDIPLYQCARQGNSIVYTINPVSGTYLIRLLFAEINPGITGPGQRLFKVAATSGSAGQYDATLLNNFDVYATAGGADIGLQRDFTVPVTDNKLTLTFTGQTGSALVCGIQIALMPAGGGVIPGIVDPASPDIPPPGWASGSVSTGDGSMSSGIGPSMGDPIDLASGAEIDDSGPDIAVYNPSGPSASFERIFTTTNAASTYGSPTLSTGWSDNYDYRFTSTSGSWGPVTLVEPTHAKTQFTPVLSGGVPTGAFTGPAETPYIVAGIAGASKGRWTSITIQYKDLSKWAFSPDATNPLVLRLTGVTNAVGHSITINRNSSFQLSTVVNDGGTTLLTFNYTSGNLSSVVDNNNREVDYTFNGGGNLSTVSQMYFNTGSAPSVPRWQYTYAAQGPHIYVRSVAAPDPANPGTSDMAMSTTDFYTSPTGEYVVANHTDANGNIFTLNHLAGTGLASVAQLSADGLLASFDTQMSGSAANQDTGFTDPDGNQATIAYDQTESGSSSPYTPSAYTDRNAETTNITYAPDGYDNPATVTDNRGDVDTYTYDYSQFPFGEVATVTPTHETGGTTDASLQGSSYAYYPSTSAFAGLLEYADTPEPGTIDGTAYVTTTLNYDPTDVGSYPLGNVSSVVAPAPASSGTVTTSYAYVNGTVTTPQLGEPVSVTDPNGNTTTYTYDARGNQTSVTDASGNTTEYFYTVDDRLQAVAYPSVSGSGNAVLYYTYQFVGGPVEYATLYSEGEVTPPSLGSVFPDPLGTVAAFRQTGYTYGHEGETLKVTDLVGQVSAYAYDGDYDTVAEADGNGNVTDYFYGDYMGDLTQVQYPLAALASGGAPVAAGTADTTTYGYDADQNLIERTDGRGVATAYNRDDPESRVTSVAYGSGGFTGSSSAGTLAPTSGLPAGVVSTGSVGYAYDLFGRTTEMTDGSGTTYYGNASGADGWDDLGNILETTRDFTGGPQGQTLTYAYYLDGSAASVKIPGGTEVTNPRTTNGGKVGYAYDTGGRLTTITNPWTVPSVGSGSGADTLSYSYEPNDWLHTVQGSMVETDYGYDPRGFVSSLTNNSEVTTNDYGAFVSGFTGMTYDAAGNRLGETVSTVNTGGGLMNWARTIGYTYDGRDRLTQEDSVAGSVTNPSQDNVLDYDENFTYDNADNIQGYKDASAPYTGDFSFNIDNQLNGLSGSGAFGYDSAGDFNLGSSAFTPLGGLFAGDTVGYDAERRLAQVSHGSTSYLANIYDGGGLRAEKTPETGASVFYLYDALSGEPLVEEGYSGGSASIEFVNIFGPDGWRERFSGASSSGNGEIAYAFDPQGSVENRYNASDQSLTADHMPATDVLVWDGYGLCLNDQWGKTASEAYDYQYNPAYDPAGFEAQYGYAGEWDNYLARNWTGTKSFQYYRYEPYLLTQRYYDPSTGKFASRDPIGTQGGENLYGYAGDDPVNEVDPSGEDGGEDGPLKHASQVGDYTDDTDTSDTSTYSGTNSVGTGGEYAAPDVNASPGPSPADEVGDSAGNAVDSAGNAVDAVAKRTTETARAIEEGVDRYGIKPYNKLRAEVKGLGLEVHHLIEKRFARQMGQTQGEMPSVALPHDVHVEITNAWRELISRGAGTKTATRQEVEDTARDIYKASARVLLRLHL